MVFWLVYPSSLPEKRNLVKLSWNVYDVQGYAIYGKSYIPVLRFAQNTTTVAGYALVYDGDITVDTMLVRRGAACITANAVRNTVATAAAKRDDPVVPGVTVSVSGASGNFTLCMSFLKSR